MRIYSLKWNISKCIQKYSMNSNIFVYTCPFIPIEKKTSICSTILKLAYIYTKDLHSLPILLFQWKKKKNYKSMSEIRMIQCALLALKSVWLRSGGWRRKSVWGIRKMQTHCIFFRRNYLKDAARKHFKSTLIWTKKFALLWRIISTHT